VKDLIHHPRVDVAVRNNIVFRTAVKLVNINIVQELLKCPNVDPTAVDNSAIYWAW
jgi:hypothetical protein